MENVRREAPLASFIRATTVEESTPPERNAPSGASERSIWRTERFSTSSS